MKILFVYMYVWTYLGNDVQYEPDWPVVAVVSPQKSTQWQHETPRQVHQHPVEVDEGEVDTQAAPLLPVLPRPRQLPHVSHYRLFTSAHGEVLELNQRNFLVEKCNTHSCTL